MRKEHMIKMKNIRILVRNIRDGFKNVFRNISLSIASISCITVTLIIVAAAIIGSWNVENFTKLIRDDFTIVAFVKNDATEEDKTRIKEELDKIKNIQTIEFISKKDIMEEMKQSSDTFNSVMSSWSDSENPLDDTYQIRVKDDEKISKTAEKIKSIDKIEKVSYGEGMVDSMISIFGIVKNVLIVIVIGLVVVTAFLIVNTIKITIFSRQEEIEIKRLVGASNMSIKQPFVIEGLLIGILGSIIPIIVTIYGYSYLYEKTGGQMFSQFIKLVKPLPFSLYVSLILLAIGVIVGMFGSNKAVRKYLKI
ncbi:MAG: permease-like cell division protein FtsX [Bacilli bacterium]|nr:permease-like cell division protein FtsX [Bacilli bacterium]